MSVTKASCFYNSWGSTDVDRTFVMKAQAVWKAVPAPSKLTFDIESGVRVTCDVGYLCANLSLPRPLFST